MENEPLCRQLSRDQVADIVERFYVAVQQDERLADYFSHIDNWPEHRGHITDFWWGLMGGHVEKPRPHAMDRGHRHLTFGTAELDRWLALFAETLRQSLPPEQAKRWMTLARQLGDKMAGSDMLNE